MAGDLVPFLAMIVVQIGYAAMTIMSKLAMDTGMDPFIHVTYRQIFGTIAIAPFAYFFEREERPRMTRSILFQIFLCSIFGSSLNQITYFVGLKNSTPTIACALSNITPALTFIFAVPFGLESVGFRTKGGQAKVWGTIVCVGGALLLSLYHGHVLEIGESSIHWKFAQNSANQTSTTTNTHENVFLGPFLIIASAVCWAIWFIIQARLNKEYNAPYSSSALMCFIASFECVVVGALFNQNISAWALTPSIRATSSIFSGIFCTALAYCVMSWCLGRKGPLYVSVFNPLLLVIVTILSWALLHEKLYTGTLVGSIMIVIGLYGVLWGKSKEMQSGNDDTHIDLNLMNPKELKEGKDDIESTDINPQASQNTSNSTEGTKE